MFSSIWATRICCVRYNLWLCFRLFGSLQINKVWIKVVISTHRNKKYLSLLRYTLMYIRSVYLIKICNFVKSQHIISLRHKMIVHPFGYVTWNKMLLREWRNNSVLAFMIKHYRTLSSFCILWYTVCAQAS